MTIFEACSLPDDLVTVAEGNLAIREIVDGLTETQRAVLALLLEGYSQKAVGRQLHLTKRQVRRSIDHIRLLYIQAWA